MPKTVVSLHRIVKEIEQAAKKLKAAEGKVTNSGEKKKLNTIIKNLNKIEKEVKNNCPKGKNSYAIAIP
jgi:uncharacterized protein Yka (UPF0111/DUF47 family)